MGPCGRNIVLGALFGAFLAISFIMSKYCVRSSRSITSWADVPLTFEEKSFTTPRRPSIIALRCLATPKPERYLLSASASAAFT